MKTETKHIKNDFAQLMDYIREHGHDAEIGGNGDLLVREHDNTEWEVIEKTPKAVRIWLGY